MGLKNLSPIGYDKTRAILFGSPSDLSFRDILMMYTCIIVAMSSFASSILNYFLELPPTMVYFALIMFGTFTGFYLIGRFRKITRLLYLQISIAALLFINIAWFFNFGSRGSVLFLFMVAYAFFIFVFTKRDVVFISILILVNLILLFTLEIRNPEFVGRYPSEYARIGDVYFGLVFSLIMMSAFVFSIKRNYEKEYKKARNADQLKSAFLANMSHEIRTPLNAIVGFSSLLAEENFNQSDKEEFKNILSANSDYLLKLIEDIIDLSKIEVGELDVRLEDVELNNLFKRISVSFQNILVNENLTINYELGSDCHLVKADAVRLEQVLRNLIGNSIKFTESGSITFGCEQEEECLRFYVTDTGIGIRPENQEKIFERFVKIDEGSNQLSRGTGIGLFLSKQLVEKMGGEIWFESEYRKGTTFYFTIKAKK